MSTITPTQSASPNPSTSDRASIAQNFDQFLMLLTAQLKNQNPMDPLDTNQFTQQLVSFASVEQQIKSNESLNSLMSSMNASNAMGALSFVGKTITASGTTTELKNNSAKWHLNSDRAGTATIKVRDKNGAVMNTYSITLAGGGQSFTWDGKTASGSPAPDGTYSITAEGTDADKKALSITSEIEGRVDSVDLTTTPPTLKIGSTTVSLNAVKSVAAST